MRNSFLGFLIAPMLLLGLAFSQETHAGIFPVDQPYLNITAPNTVSGLVASGVFTSGGTISGGTKFTITSGCGTTTALTGGATTGSFVVGQTGCVPIVALPTAPNGWMCWANDVTTPADIFTQTAKSATSCTLSATVSASDVVVFHAEAY